MEDDDPHHRRPLRLSHTTRPDGATVLLADGDLMVSTAQDLRDALDRLAGDHTRVVLDLSQVRFLDSTGLQVLIQATHDARRDGGSFVLARSLSRAVSDFFDMSGAHSFLPLEGPA